jgi:polyisoprenoid-binding protein YceI
MHLDTETPPRTYARVLARQPEPPGDVAEAHRRARGTWVFDTVRSSIRFSVRRIVVGSVEGEFNRWRGRLTFDPAASEASTLSVHIDAASIETGDPARNEHLRSSSVLDAAVHPQLAFESEDVRVVSGTELVIHGTFTLRGARHRVVLQAKYRGVTRDGWGNDHLGFTVTGRLGERLNVVLEIEATRVPHDPSAASVLKAAVVKGVVPSAE